MALGVAMVAQRFENPRELLGDRLRGVHRLLADHGERLFPGDYFADVYKDSRRGDRKSTRLNSSHGSISYAGFCLKKKKKINDSCLHGVKTTIVSYNVTLFVLF